MRRVPSLERHIYRPTGLLPCVVSVRAASYAYRSVALSPSHVVSASPIHRRAVGKCDEVMHVI
jgi:hypothetical protein